MYRSLLLLSFLFYSLGLRAEPAVHTVVTSVRPLTLMVQELTQSLPLDVKTLLPKGTTPHDYALKPSDIKAIYQAESVIWLGPASELYLSKVITKAKRSLAWQQIDHLHRLPMRQAMHAHNHDHDDHGDDMNFDPHFWFSVENAIALLNAMEKELLLLNSDWATALEQNKNRMIEKLQQQVEQTQQQLKSNPQPFLLAHDAYQYLEHDLALHSVAAVVLDPEIKPGVKHVMNLKNLVSENKVACVVTDPMVSSALLKKIDTESKLESVSIDPMGWDFHGNEYSKWLSNVYIKMKVCVQPSS